MANHILGISAHYHDSAAVLVRDGEIVAASQEERFSRKKHDARFPAHAVAYCLREAGLRVTDLDHIVFYDKPLLKFERLLETYLACAPRGLASFTAAMPVWLKEKLFLKRIIRKELEAIGGAGRGDALPLLFPEHHLSHAASAFYPSPFQSAAILTVDGVGEWATTTIGRGDGSGIRILRELSFPHSLGLLYSAFTSYCGFRVNSGEYKLMGLAPYGDRTGERFGRFRAAIVDRLVDIREDGSLLLNLPYFGYVSGLRMCNDARWQALLGIPRRRPEGTLTQAYCDLALAAQDVTEEIMLKLAATASRLTGCENLVIAGGVGLNCTANGRILREGPFRNVWIQPAAGDAGGALGAALAGLHLWRAVPRRPGNGRDGMNGAHLGPGLDRRDVDALVKRHAAVAHEYPDYGGLASETSRRIAEGQIVGWVQGRMEWGPRALGSRSILADARDPQMQKRLNAAVKLRELFRPFAPAVAEEDAASYFDLSGLSPYMLLTAPVSHRRRRPVPTLPPEATTDDRAGQVRSDIPAVTHADFSARLQTVSRDTNERFWLLLNAFKRVSGCAVLINTSFNVRGEPPVCTAEDAYRCFMNTGLDVLVIGDHLFDKKEQPPWRGETYRNLGD